MVNVEFKRAGLKSLKRLVTCLLVTACLLLAGGKVADASEDIDALAFSSTHQPIYPSTHPPFNPSTPETPKLISLDFQDADVVPILRLLGRVSERNIVIHPDVKGTITLRLMDVPWQLAMDIILRTFNLKKIIEEDIIRILPLEAFEGEVKAAAAERDAVMAAKDIETRVFRIVHIDPAEAKGIIEGAGILTPRGTITIDERTRSIIMIDVPAAHVLAENLISAIDIPTPQVLIEARMVEVREIYAHAFGVQWGFWAEEGRFVWGGSIEPAPDEPIAPVPGGTVPMIVDLPTIEPTGALTIGFLNAAQTLGLDLRISALEAIDKAEMISNPRIMALCGVEASISQGREITVPLGEGEYTTVEALLELAITPEILIDGTILLDLEVTNNTIVTPIHPIETAIREAITGVSLRDGETVVIGGILITEEFEVEEAVPGISKIPLLGRLFRHEVKEIRTDEMIIFITPRIMR
ncbi:type IV pilus secretin PilQ [Thermodesulfovibrionales bacterium]|nr:type IV pilus secretin PilQ [Thermodesulfovibrionales bacterium]